MSNAIKTKFVKLWNQEYTAATKILELEKEVQRAELRDRSTKALEKKITTQENKVAKANDSIVKMIVDGLVDENSHTLYKDALGELYGYVNDCYFECFTDAEWYKERASI